MELGQGSKTKNHNKGMSSKLGPKGGVSKKQKFLGKCFNCGKQGHKSSYCRLPKRNKSKEANVVDDISKDVYLLKSKDEAIEKFVLNKNEVENQLNKKIKVLRSDRGGEYESPFVDFCA